MRITFAINLREQWIDKFTQEFRNYKCDSYFIWAAGLPILELVGSMPLQLVLFRREIIERAYFRAFPKSGFYNFRSFWDHLCDIQPSLKESKL
jgi:hypothetical protein